MTEALDLTPLELMFWQALAMIVAASVFVPLFRRLGLGSILGFLAAGVAVQFLGLHDHPEELLHFAEFGVTLFLFVIGLELRPRELWAMRRDIFGLGLAQVLGCGALLAIAALAWGLSPGVAATVGLGLALSSTALVMRTLDERRARSRPYGRKAFAILLLQDLAIVPLLLMVSLLAPQEEAVGLLDGLVRILLAVAAIAFLLLAGRFLLNPMFRLIAAARTPEIMTASALGVVIAAAGIADIAGMSYAMGAFIAGVLLADSAYRHEVEANVEPFRGLFLGLFFLAVGLSLDLGAVAQNWQLVLIATPFLMALKAGGIFAVARGLGEPTERATRIALALPQFGEFGFVLFSTALAVGLLDPQTAASLVAIVTLSMALSPLVERIEPLLLRTNASAAPPDEDFSDADARILVVGFGRFGQIVAQPLFAAGRDVTILDQDPTRVEEAQRFGFRVHYGDGTRRDVLRAAGIGEVDLILVCVDDEEAAVAVLELARAEVPDCAVYVRAYDRRHALRLMQLEVDLVVRETFEAALSMGNAALKALGLADDAAERIVTDVRGRDIERLRLQAEGDVRSGLDRLHVSAVRPEPLPRETADDDPPAIDTPGEGASVRPQEEKR